MERLRGGLIVSCQAEEGDPFHKPEYVSLFARAAEMGGASAIRACGSRFVRSIRKAVSLPIIGIEKSHFDDGSVLITPRERDVERLVSSGADIVALDATARLRPGGLSGPQFIALLKRRWPELPLIADISTIEEGIAAASAGADAVATTLSGYTPTTSMHRNSLPDFDLARELVGQLSIPVIVEGRVSKPSQALHALRLGAHAVVVGTAITRPRLVTREFVSSMTSP